jgi:hypothetical protein
MPNVYKCVAPPHLLQSDRYRSIKFFVKHSSSVFEAQFRDAPFCLGVGDQGWEIFCTVWESVADLSEAFLDLWRRKSRWFFGAIEEVVCSSQNAGRRVCWREAKHDRQGEECVGHGWKPPHWFYWLWQLRYILKALLIVKLFDE